MTTRPRELRDAVRGYLRDRGIDVVEFDYTGSCHQAAYFALDGREVRYTFANTASDRRTRANTVRSLKRFIDTPRRPPAAR